MVEGSSEQRKGQIMAMFANALNALEAEVDKPDGIGVEAEVLEDIRQDLDRIFTRWVMDGTEEGDLAYKQHFDYSYQGGELK